jgi:hypothetical protein
MASLLESVIKDFEPERGLVQKSLRLTDTQYLDRASATGELNNNRLLHRPKDDRRLFDPRRHESICLPDFPEP